MLWKNRFYFVATYFLLFKNKFIPIIPEIKNPNSPSPEIPKIFGGIFAKANIDEPTNSDEK